MSKGYFITATNTERGKTLFAAGLTLWLRENDINIIPMKPVQSGTEGSKIAPDLEYNFKITDINPTEEELKLIQPYCFSDPCSPHLAAERDNLPYPSINYIKDCAEKLLERYDMIIVEGAGGLLVPIDRKKKLYIIDLIKALDLDVILVAQSSLGTVNDTCLSIEALQKRNINIAGFIFNDWDKFYGDDYIRRDNSKVITEFTNVKYLGRMPYIENINKKNLLNVFDGMIELKNLFKK